MCVRAAAIYGADTPSHRPFGRGGSHPSVSSFARFSRSYGRHSRSAGFPTPTQVFQSFLRLAGALPPLMAVSLFSPSDRPLTRAQAHRLPSPPEREFAAFYSRRQPQLWWHGIVNPWGELRDITYETHNGCSRSRRLQNTFSQSCAGCHRHLMCRARADSLTGANRENPRPGIWPFCSSAAQRLRSMPSIKLRDR